MKSIRSYEEEVLNENEPRRGEIFLSESLGDRIEVSSKRVAKAISYSIQRVVCVRDELSHRELRMILEGVLEFSREFLNFHHEELESFSEKFAQYISDTATFSLGEEEVEIFGNIFKNCVEGALSMRVDSEEDFLLTDAELTKVDRVIKGQDVAF